MRRTMDTGGFSERQLEAIRLEQERLIAEYEGKNQAVLAEYEAKNRIALAEYGAKVQAAVAKGLANHKVVNQSGAAALKSAILINGGAGVALLAFLGSAVSSGVDLERSVAYGLLLFVSGVLSAAMASGATYAALHWQEADYIRLRRTGGGWWLVRFGFPFFNGITIALVALSYATFAAGALVAVLWGMPLANG